MQTSVWPIDPDHPDASVIARAAAVVRRGGLVAFPTETVYGLGADATSPAAVEQIYVAKGRDRDDPLIVHIATIQELERVATGVSPLTRALAETFWPGPLTVIARRHAGLAEAVGGGRETVAVRMPSHPVALALIQAAGVPIAAPSANRFMHTSPTAAKHVLDDLDGAIDLVLDGGPVTVGIESTVVAVEGNEVRILRPGGVSAEELAAAVALLDADATVVEASGTQASASPGTLSRHYAPGIPLTLITGPGRLAVAAAEYVAAAPPSDGLALCAPDSASDAIRGVVAVERLGPEDAPAVHAQRLYAALRALEGCGANRILAVYFADGGLGRAVLDRLRRAAAEVIEVQG
ncbi:MAG: L-threonylcarbamoyladenylate synthase [Dehalococcoidia bacterium]